MNASLEELETELEPAEAGALGAVVAVDGSVVDVRFYGADLPEINTVLDVRWDCP
ncbi:MAG: hypothetical protein AAFW87_05845 [Pseudomonadota bacterium]